MREKVDSATDRFAGFPPASWASPAGWARLHLGDCVEVMRSLPESSIDAIVTDPPYGLEFMGKDWDNLTNYASIKPGNDSPHSRKHSVSYIGSPNPTCRKCGGLRSLLTEGSGGRTKCRCEVPDFPNYQASAMRSMQEWHYAWAVEAFRVLKPGGHLLAFGGTRTYHRMACAIEDAGFEIRDCLMWLYGSGFPKSLDVSKAIDKAAGAEREDLGPSQFAGKGRSATHNSLGGKTTPSEMERVTAPATAAARQWSGWGTALKPAWEPIVVARKPLDGTVAENALKHGTGALNIDGCRVAGPKGNGTWGSSNATCQEGRVFNASPDGEGFRSERRPEGRFPANVVLAHTPDCALKGTRRVRGITGTSSGRMKGGSTATYGEFGGVPDRVGEKTGYTDAEGMEVVEDWECAPGCPVRMLPQSDSTRASGNPNNPVRGVNHLASSYGQGDGRETFDYRDSGSVARFFYTAKADSAERWIYCRECKVAVPSSLESAHRHGKEGREHIHSHPTVKPLDLMRWLCRLVSGPDGSVVLDPFMGSGTTGVAALLEGQRFVGVEKDGESFALSKGRMGEPRRQQDLFEGA